MDTNNGLNRPTKYALIAAAAAGLVSFVLITVFIDMLTLLFVPSVTIMVFISAYFAFKRKMKHRKALNGNRIFMIALEVGTVTHFYTFALYLPIVYFMDGGGTNISPEIFGAYLIYTAIAGVVSLIMFIWIAVPLYIGVGYLLKSMEGEEVHQRQTLDDSLLDDGLVSAD